MVELWDEEEAKREVKGNRQIKGGRSNERREDKIMKREPGRTRKEEWAQDKTWLWSLSQ